MLSRFVYTLTRICSVSHPVFSQARGLFPRNRKGGLRLAHFLIQSCAPAASSCLLRRGNPCKSLRPARRRPFPWNYGPGDSGIVGMRRWAERRLSGVEPVIFHALPFSELEEELSPLAGSESNETGPLPMAKARIRRADTSSSLCPSTHHRQRSPDARTPDTSLAQRR